jgi:hypothetical protein
LSLRPNVLIIFSTKLDALHALVDRDLPNFILFLTFSRILHFDSNSTGHKLTTYMPYLILIDQFINTKIVTLLSKTIYVFDHDSFQSNTILIMHSCEIILYRIYILIYYIYTYMTHTRLLDR